MSEWIDVSELQPASIEVPGPHGLRIRMFASPYDVPTAIRSDYDAASGRFVIQFRYMSSEPEKSERSNQLWLSVGKRSGRIYRIGIEVKQADVAQLALAIRRLVEAEIEARLGEDRSHAELRARFNAAAIETVLADAVVMKLMAAA